MIAIALGLRVDYLMSRAILFLSEKKYDNP